MNLSALVVEDAEFFASIYRHALTMVAEKVYIAHDLTSAMKIVREQVDLHIVTLDLHLPDCTIKEVLESIATIHTMHPDCAVILLTGDESEETRRQSEGYGPDAFAHKHDVSTTPLLLKIVLTALAKRAKGSPSITARLNELVEKLAQLPTPKTEIKTTTTP